MYVFTRNKFGLNFLGIKATGCLLSDGRTLALGRLIGFRFKYKDACKLFVVFVFVFVVDVVVVVVVVVVVFIEL